MKKESRIYSIVNCKCPRCHEGDLFTNKISYNIKKLTEMNTHCNHCGLEFTPEPGYFYGAMYVSYGLTALEMFLVVIGMYIFSPQAPTWAFYFASLLGVFILTPWNYRIGRAGWINLFYSYDKNAAKGYKI